MKYIFKLFFWLIPLISATQEIFQWNDYLPYSNCTKTIIGNNGVFALTPNTALQFDNATESIERINKINYLSDVGITDAGFTPQNNSLVVGYTNGNIDIIQGARTYNFQDVIRATQITNKTINQVFVIDTTAYISGGFGIIVFDLNKLEISENYQVGPSSNPIEVNAISFLNDTLFAATNKGIYWALTTNPLLKFPQAWSPIKNFSKQGADIKQIFKFNDQVYVNYALETFLGDTLYKISTIKSEEVKPLTGNNNYGFSINNNQLVVAHNFNVAVYDEDFTNLVTYFDYQTNTAPQPRFGVFDEEGVMWIADQNQGLIKAKDPFNNEVILPSSPKYMGNRDIISNGNKTIITRGERESNWGKTFTEAGIMVYEDAEWSVINRQNTTALDTVKDIINLDFNQTNSSTWAAASLGYGIFEFDENNKVSVYNEQNSTLQKIDGYGVGVSDVKYDRSGNLWATNMLTNQPLHVKNEQGEWSTFNFNGMFNDAIPGELLIDGFGNKWVIIQNEGVLVFDENGTINDPSDDDFKLLSTAEGNGNLPSANVLSIAEDKDGELWIGTDLGLRVIYSPEQVFQSSGFDAQDILIKQGLYFQILLESEAINCIAVDGGDNKWIGTLGSGIFLLSPDGQEELFHFTAENSPLWSNNIQSIEINPNTGEVFIGTDKGLISFKGGETEPNQDYSNIYAYPNPVPPNYNGSMAVNGLVRNSEVRITDLAGNIIYKTTAPGGQVVWDLNTLNGNKARPGVYLVYVSTLDGTQKAISKVLVQ